MNIKNYYLFLILFSAVVNAQNPVLIGYWQNWNDSAAPYIPLDQVDSRYSVICVSFAVPTSPSDMTMLFTPDGISQSTFITQIQALQSQGKKVLISIGGATTSMSLNNNTNRDAFVSTMTAMLNTYHFDGIDIDIEHGDSILASGTIANPTNINSVNLIAAINQIRENFNTVNTNDMMLTFAPETAYVQGGMSAYGGIWGGYLPVLDALRNYISYIHVQLYNSGSVFGIDGNIYTQGNADFIVAMTEALIHGFNTGGGNFAGFPASKVAIGLPACPNAAGGGFVSPAVVASAVQYLRGFGPQPGSYLLSQAGGYPNLGGMMDWSVNWDKVTTCNTSSYEYAANFMALFGTLGVNQQTQNPFSIAPNPVKDQLLLSGNADLYQIANISGQIVQQGKIENQSIIVSDLQKGLYFITIDNQVMKLMKE